MYQKTNTSVAGSDPGYDPRAEDQIEPLLIREEGNIGLSNSHRTFQSGKLDLLSNRVEVDEGLILNDLIKEQREEREGNHFIHERMMRL